MTLLHATYMLSKAQVQPEPGVIVGPIAMVFGYIIDFIFNLVYALTINNSLGISIIFLTIIVRCLMLPLAAKQQKSMIAMQKLNPDVEKIKKKYGGTKDAEMQKKMNTEIQALYAKNKVNPFSGCLPLLITMPLFFGLSYIMNQSYLYVSKLGALYSELSTRIMAVPEYVRYVKPLALPHVPQKMLDNQEINISIVSHLSKVLNKFDAEDWRTLFAQIPAEYVSGIKEIFEHKEAVELFFGLPLVESAGWGWPGILIPILAALTTFLSSYISMQINQSTDQTALTQQKVMLTVMPVMMGFMTVGMPAGVGLYWITSSVFQVGQQLVLNKRSGIPLFKKKNLAITSK